MKAISAAAILGLTLAGTLAPASAQYYDGRGGGGDYGYRDRDRGGDYGRDRGYDRRDRDSGYEDRGRRGGERGDYAFDEQEYIRCNPDVRRAIVNGTLESGLKHYRLFGRKEGRRLSC